MPWFAETRQLGEEERGAGRAGSLLPSWPRGAFSLGERRLRASGEKGPVIHPLKARVISPPVVGNHDTGPWRVQLSQAIATPPRQYLHKRKFNIHFVVSIRVCMHACVHARVCVCTCASMQLPLGPAFLF